jgi:uncharacterized protein (TIGR02996 family)
MRERFLDNTPMSDRDALLRAICENPDDDAPRLIYADWLDEHGRTEDAEFIRVQIELARQKVTAQYREHDDGFFRYPANIERLIVRQTQLWSKSKAPPDLPNELKSFATLTGLGVEYFFVRRGFVEQISLFTKRFLRIAKRLFSTQPITQVILVDRQPSSTGRGFIWIRGCQDKRRDELPEELWPFILEAHIAATKVGIEEGALAALNSACVSYGRIQAGHPPLQ